MTPLDGGRLQRLAGRWTLSLVPTTSALQTPSPDPAHRSRRSSSRTTVGWPGSDPIDARRPLAERSRCTRTGSVFAARTSCPVATGDPSGTVDGMDDSGDVRLPWRPPGERVAEKRNYCEGRSSESVSYDDFRLCGRWAVEGRAIRTSSAATSRPRRSDCIWAVS